MLWGAVLAAVLLQQTFARAARPDGIDLTSYLLSARALAHGASPYLLATPFPYLYPPTLAFLLIPLTFVPAGAAVVIWFALNGAAAVWAVRRVALTVRPRHAEKPDVLALFLAVFFTFFLPIVQSNLRNGQVNFLVLALCIASALPKPNGASVVAASPPALPAPPAPPALPALFWSLAIAIKVVPVVLLPWFLVRRTRLWVLTSVVACLALLALPAAASGGRIVDMYWQFARVMQAAGFAPHAAPLDFSLAGLIAALTGAPATPALRLSAAAVVFGWILQADARRLRTEEVRPLALYLLGIPLASPKSEVHHLAFVFPAAAVVALECWSPSRTKDRTFVAAASAAAALYVIAIALPRAGGPIYCAGLIAAATALVNLHKGHVR